VGRHPREIGSPSFFETLQQKGTDCFRIRVVIDVLRDLYKSPSLDIRILSFSKKKKILNGGVTYNINVILFRQSKRISKKLERDKTSRDRRKGRKYSLRG
jgi:hypothetical protein